MHGLSGGDRGCAGGQGAWHDLTLIDVVPQVLADCFALDPAHGLGKKGQHILIALACGAHGEVGHATVAIGRSETGNLVSWRADVLTWQHAEDYRRAGELYRVGAGADA
jgi:hypothetical protein